MAITFEIKKIKYDSVDLLQIIKNDDVAEATVDRIVLVNPVVTLEPTPEDRDNSIRITTSNKLYDIPKNGLVLFGNNVTETAVLDVINNFYNSYD
jgi:hypothetical protein